MPRGGLVSLRERAERYGGGCELLPAQPHGTTLRWQVPV